MLAVLFVSVAHSFLPMMGLLLFPFASLAVVIWVVAALFRATASAWKGSWRDSCRRLVFVAFAMPLVAAAFLFGDYAHLAVMYPVYARRIAVFDGKDEIAFGWGGTGFAGSANSIRSLIYNPKGAKVGVRPLDAEPTVSVVTSHLLGHFYTREISW